MLPRKAGTLGMQLGTRCMPSHKGITKRRLMSRWWGLAAHRSPIRGPNFSRTHSPSPGAPLSGLCVCVEVGSFFRGGGGGGRLRATVESLPDDICELWLSPADGFLLSSGGD